MFLGFLNKVKAITDKNAPKLEQAIACVRNGDYDEALLVAMESMTKAARVKYVAKFVSNSHWRINSSALEIFNQTIDKFILEGKTKLLENYLTQLSTEVRSSSSSHAHLFYQIRSDIIKDLLHNTPANSALAVVQTYRLEEMISNHNPANDVKVRYGHTVIDVMNQVWPKKGMLKVLYG